MKKLLAMITACLLLCACAGCGTGMNTGSPTTEPAKETTNVTEATVPTTEATEPTTEATEPVTEAPELPLVVDAVNVTKEIIVAPEWEGIWEPGDMKHSIQLPKINLDTPGAQQLNDTIMDCHGSSYETLMAGQEGTEIYICEYKWALYHDLLAIVIYDGWAAQMAGANIAYRVYYYDINTDEALSFDQYLQRMKTDQDTLFKAFKATEEYQNTEFWEGPPTELTDCVIGPDSMLFFFMDDGTMDGWNSIETALLI